MSARQLAGIIGMVALLAAGFSEADTARVEPLDGTPSPNGRPNGSVMRPQHRPLVFPDDQFPTADPPSQASTPWGSPKPPSQLTPAPMLPFNPNRPLMPSPSAPSPSSGSGRAGR